MDNDINFRYDANTEVDHSCAASLHDEMWVLGGRYQKRQVNLKLHTNAVDKEMFCMTASGIKCILDEQGSRLQIDKCRRIAFRFLWWWM